MIAAGTADYRRVTWGMALGSFLVFANLYLFQPILPRLAMEFALTATQVNWVFAASTLTLALSLVFWAVVSDRIGRKKIMLLGLFLAAVVHAFLLATPSYFTLIAARGLMGIALGAFAAVGMAYMAEEMAESAFSIAAGGYVAANSLGGIAGRIVGGVVTDQFDWQLAVAILAVATTAGFLVLIRLLPAERQFTVRRTAPGDILRELGSHLNNPIVWFAMLIGGLNFALFVNLFSVIGFRLTAPPFQLPVGLAALIFLCYLPGTFSAQFSSRMTPRGNAMRGIQYGACISIVGLLLGWLDHVATILVSLLLISGGAFFIHALAFGWVSLRTRSGKATASALYLVHYYAGGSIGGFALLFFWERGGWPAVIACSMTLYGLLIWLSVSLDRRYR